MFQGLRGGNRRARALQVQIGMAAVNCHARAFERILIVAALALLAYAPESLALPLSSPSASLTGSKSLATTVPSRGRNLDEFSLSVGQEGFFDREDPPAGTSDYTRFSARLRTRAEERPMGGTLEVEGIFDARVEKQTMIAVPEAYLSWSYFGFGSDFDDEEPGPELIALPRAPLKLAVGRKMEAWSELDSAWNLGIWQPLNRFDGLRPSEQGLTGVFANFGTDRWELILFGSPIFIPEQGPNFELNNGRFQSGNPWFVSPHDSLILFSKETAIRYQLEMPTVGSVISHPSGGFLMRAGGIDGLGFQAQLAFAKKPRNQLSVPFSGRHMTGEVNQESAVTIYPQIAYHNLLSVDLSQRWQNAQMGVSGLLDVADSEVAPEGTTSQKLQPLTLLSPNLQFRAMNSRVWVPWIRLSSLHSFGGEADVSGSLQASRNPFGPRTMFRQAASLELKGRFARVNGWRIEHGLKWIEEFSEDGSVLMADLRLSSPQSWNIGFWVDLLSSRLPEDQNPGFISRFRGNDRAGAKLTYLF
jgi:hypothetical protein